MPWKWERFGFFVHCKKSKFQFLKEGKNLAKLVFLIAISSELINLNKKSASLIFN